MVRHEAVQSGPLRTLSLPPQTRNGPRPRSRAVPVGVKRSAVALLSALVDVDAGAEFGDLALGQADTLPDLHDQVDPGRLTDPERPAGVAVGRGRKGAVRVDVLRALDQGAFAVAHLDRLALGAGTVLVLRLEHDGDLVFE